MSGDKPRDPFVRAVSDIDALHANITDALSELRGARTIHKHSPTAENLRVIDLCEWRLDILLARQRSTMGAMVDAGS